MTAEAVIVEGVAREIRDDEPEPDRRLATVPRQNVQVGLGAVMTLSDEEFETNLTLLTKGVLRAKRIQQAILEPGVDYGTVPGIPRPFLHKPGAEKFEKAYGLAISYDIERKVGDGAKTPELEYIVHAKVHLGDTEGPVVAEGVGSCNTHESKYRYRQAKPSCPDCGRTTIIKGKDDGKLKGKWWCATRDGGCGHTFEKDDARLAEQPVGQVENENPWDLANTIVKMARKRAGVDAILTATGTSGLFTQDDDSPSVQRDATGAPAAAATEARQTQQQQPAQQATSSSKTDLPAMPKTGTISEPTSVGRIVLEGVTTSVGRAPFDGEYRKTGDVPLGFIVHVGDTKIPQVVVLEPLAGAVVAAMGDPGYLADATANVVGELWAIPWEKDGEAKPPMRRLVVELIATEHFRLPARTKTADAPAEDVGQVDEHDAREAQEQAVIAASDGKPADDREAQAEALLEATGQLEPAAAGEPGGLSIPEFRAALAEHRIATNLATQVMKRDFKTDELGHLSPVERQQLLDTLLK